MSAEQLQDGWVMWSCDHPACEESVEFRPTLEDTAKIEVRPTPGEAGPEDWVVHLADASAEPAGPRHFCPAHAEDAD
jgi:hypothetical protein